MSPIYITLQTFTVHGASRTRGTGLWWFKRNMHLKLAPVRCTYGFPCLLGCRGHGFASFGHATSLESVNLSWCPNLSSAGMHVLGQVRRTSSSWSRAANASLEHCLQREWAPAKRVGVGILTSAQQLGSWDARAGTLSQGQVGGVDFSWMLVVLARKVVITGREFRRVGGGIMGLSCGWQERSGLAELANWRCL